jgi:hypothetical protein
VTDHDAIVSVRCAILTCGQLLRVERRHAVNLRNVWRCTAHRQEAA